MCLLLDVTHISFLLKKIFIILLALASLIVSSQYSFTWLAFKINQDYIAKNLCVQKDIQNNSCKGCCQLKKQMEQQTEQESKSNQSQRKITIDGFITCKLKLPSSAHFFEILFGDNHLIYCNIHLRNLFRPPQLA